MLQLVREAKGVHPLVILVRTGGPRSPERLESIRSTWGRGVPDHQLTLFDPHDREECDKLCGDNYGRGLTCLDASAYIKLMNRTDWKWLLAVDDDT